MRDAIEIFCAFLPLLCAFVPPFISVLRGGGLLKAFLVAWFGMVASIVVFGLVIPLLLYRVDTKIGQAAFNLFPDLRGAIAMLFLGWIPAIFMVSVAMGVRKLASWIRDEIRRRHEVAEVS
jgi:hypothetical protein